MKPGEACGRCHDFGAAGTVYPTAHEPNDCKGANLAGAKIIVVDAANKTTTIAVNAAGNFISTASFKMPIKVSVSANGATRAMSTPLTAAMGTDCNACHTQNGAGSPKAPGRILAP
jgi:cytochrome c553